MKAESKAFYRSLAALVIPITIQNFITNAVNSADVLMLGYVGQTELSAVSLANQFQFLLSGLFFWNFLRSYHALLSVLGEKRYGFHSSGYGNCHKNCPGDYHNDCPWCNFYRKYS